MRYRRGLIFPKASWIRGVQGKQALPHVSFPVTGLLTTNSPKTVSTHRQFKLMLMYAPQIGARTMISAEKAQMFKAKPASNSSVERHMSGTLQHDWTATMGSRGQRGSRGRWR